MKPKDKYWTCDFKDHEWMPPILVEIVTTLGDQIQVIDLDFREFYTSKGMLFVDERDALKWFANKTEDIISRLQGKLTRARLRYSKLTPNPYDQ